jgi:hypothetical protein
MRLAILIEGKVSRWQHKALERISRKHEIYLLTSSGHRHKKSAKHAFYYALNLFTIRNHMTRKVELAPEALNVRGSLSFSPSFEGAWAVLPKEVFDWVAAHKIDAIVKFGLGLLRIPDPALLPVPILSYHHGDPRSYRGRPAGFYELLNGEPYVGQIVQALGAKLDAGTVYAFTQSRAIPYSYRKTLIEAYSLSPYLLETAVENLCLNRPVQLGTEGRNYRLPPNGTVLRFCAQRLWQGLRHLWYGAFIEKRWKVAVADLPQISDPSQALRDAPAVTWSTLPVAPGYNFYADPFFGASEDEIFLEALSERTGKGEVVRIAEGKQEKIDGFKGHVSYPASLRHEGRQLLIPETSGWCPPTAFEIAGGVAKAVRTLDIDESEILDPTLFSRDGHLYLFANTKADGPSVLHLWHATGLSSRFERHPASPIRVSSRGSRMAGEVGDWGGKLFRLGQDWRRAYGDGILVFEITQISPTAYSEASVGESHFEQFHGPHTVNHRGQRLLFDYYTEDFSLLAGVRRMRRGF